MTVTRSVASGPQPFNASTWLLDRHVEQGRGDREAVRFNGGSLSYADVLARVNGAAGCLSSLGVRPEERVFLVLLDSVAFVAAFLGAMRIGAVPVPVNPLLPASDVAALAADARARVAVISPELAPRMAAPLMGAAPELAELVTADELELAADDDPNRPQAAAYSTWDESPGFWLCTSGSTGMPKLAMHCHADLRYTAETYGQEVLGVTADDRCYSVGPMFHAYGLGNSLTFPLAAGATTILESERPPTPARVAQIVTTERPTLFFCIPTFYAALLAAELPHDTFASVRYAVSAAEPLPAETFRRFKERFGVEILDGIGSTELTHIFVSNRPGAIRPGTSGQPVGGYAVRLLDDAGAEVDDGEPGHLFVGGGSMASGYWCRADVNRRTFQGEHMRTGDIYTRTDGWYTYWGRSDDMLRVGGEWVSPAEVEATLIAHPDVLEAAVVGERDEQGVQRPLAYVVPQAGQRPDVNELATMCRVQLAGYKRPRRFLFVDSLPKTATGKIQRFKLRA